MTFWHKRPADSALGYPYRTASPPPTAPAPLARSARLAIQMAAMGWALVLTGALVPGLAGAEGLGGIVGLIGFKAWTINRRAELDGPTA